MLAVVKRNSFLEQKLDSQNIMKSYVSVLNRHFPVVATYQLTKIIEKKDIDILKSKFSEEREFKAWVKILRTNHAES